MRDTIGLAGIPLNPREQMPLDDNHGNADYTLTGYANGINFIDNLIRLECEVTVFLVNGVKLGGVLVAAQHNRKLNLPVCLFLKHEDRVQLIFQRQVATVMPPKHVMAALGF